MLGVDLAVWLAMLLSLASAVLCVVYGLSHWNADDDPPPTPSTGHLKTSDQPPDASQETPQ